jgi:hypothetical protein
MKLNTTKAKQRIANSIQAMLLAVLSLSFGLLLEAEFISHSSIAYSAELIEEEAKTEVELLSNQPDALSHAGGSFDPPQNNIAFYLATKLAELYQDLVLCVQEDRVSLAAFLADLYYAHRPGFFILFGSFKADLI